jgi:hypothetical protein
MLKKIKSVLYLVLAVSSVLLTLGIELHQRLNGHSFDFAQLAMRSLHHEHLIAGSLLIGIFFSIKFMIAK